MTAERTARESRRIVLTLLLIEREQLKELEMDKKSPASVRGKRSTPLLTSGRSCSSRGVAS